MYAQNILFNNQVTSEETKLSEAELAVLSPGRADPACAGTSLF